MKNCLQSNPFTLTFRGQRILIYSYNKNEQDALFLKCILTYSKERSP
jgi:predicted SPOUT superfamily RNA methylase MTH1